MITCSWCKKRVPKNEAGLMKTQKSIIWICKECYDKKKYRNIGANKNSFDFK